MTNKLTREFMQNIISGHGFGVAPSAVKAMAEYIVAAMDGEPVGYFGRFDPDDEDLIDQCSKNVKGAFPLYRHAQPAPVVSSEPVAYTDERNLGYIDRGRETAYLWGKQNSESSDVALYRHAQQPVVPATLPCSVELKPGLIIGKGCKTETLLTALRRRADYNADIDAMTPEERAEHDASIKTFKAMLAAAPQEVPDGK
ncbi:hypothetical protein ABN150_21840 [Klebsiella oxytoca]|uniref:hypothetical protein n=1 Tax=Klebsiella oxytoca TaxID=571 RepID=UPI0032DA42AD